MIVLSQDQRQHFYNWLQQEADEAELVIASLKRLPVSGQVMMTIKKCKAEILATAVIMTKLKELA